MSNLTTSHNFIVYMGSMEMSFSKISGIEQKLDVQEIQEGGNPRAVFLYGAKKIPGRLKFEHGTGLLNKANEAFNKAFTLQSLEYTFRGFGIIVALRHGKVSRAYEYQQALPVSWSVSGFDAKTGNILIDTVELMHNGIFEIPCGT
ncbi:MAG: phage tail protein [Defluviitaleaceae bacterium]|nr:phage tail protein [Defluviitaleaceae bacterium]